MGIVIGFPAKSRRLCPVAATVIPSTRLPFRDSITTGSAAPMRDSTRWAECRCRTRLPAWEFRRGKLQLFPQQVRFRERATIWAAGASPAMQRLGIRGRRLSRRQARHPCLGFAREAIRFGLRVVEFRHLKSRFLLFRIMPTDRSGGGDPNRAGSFLPSRALQCCRARFNSRSTIRTEMP
jgi:hypothetical protein